MKNVLLFGMPNSETLSNKIASLLKIKITKIDRTVFSDGELLLKSSKTVRNRSVYIICNTSTNVSIIELLIFIDSIKRASAGKITVICSYYGYSRQDRKSNKRDPITCKLMANLFRTAGVDKMITVDLHNPSIQGFFDMPVDDLKWAYSLAKRLRKEKLKYTVVSPDHGGAVRARKLAELLSHSIKIAIVDKRRVKPNQSEIMNILGDVKNKNVVIIDDIIDTGGTILNAAKRLKEEGAKKIFIAATHAIFSKSFEAFEKSEFIDKVFLSDSIENKSLVSEKIEFISLSPLLSKVIKANEKSESISKIYEDFTQNEL